MDKQKQINELVKIITKEYPNKFAVSHPAKAISVATEILKHYQPKIPENAVVLETSVYESLEIKNYRDFISERVRKETAEKFARLVEFHSVATRDESGRELFSISALGLKEILVEEFGFKYDEICKELSEGKV